MIHSKDINQKNKQQQSGFTLLELLMVIAVIGILATIAVPRLQNYSQRAKFTEVINATAPYKSAVEKCINETGSATACDANTPYVPAGFTTQTGKVASLAVVDGKITATAIGDFGTAAAAEGAAGGNITYEVTPNVKDNGIVWEIGGTCKSVKPALCD